MLLTDHFAHTGLHANDLVLLALPGLRIRGTQEPNNHMQRYLRYRERFFFNFMHGLSAFAHPFPPEALER